MCILEFKMWMLTASTPSELAGSSTSRPGAWGLGEVGQAGEVQVKPCAVGAGKPRGQASPDAHLAHGT